MSSPETKETAAIRARIERTRGEMSATIDAIQEKLSPQQIAEQVRHTVSEQIEGAKASVREATIGKAETFMRDASDSVKDVRYSTTDTIRNNPIPAAMVAIGLGWLFMNRSSSRRERFDEYTRRRAGIYDQGRYGEQRYGGEMYYNPNHPAYRSEAMAMYGTPQRHDEGMVAQGQRRVGEAVGQAQSVVGDAAQRAQGAVGGAVNQAQNVAQQAASAVGDVAQRAQSAVGSTVNRAQEGVGSLAGRTAYTAERVEDQFQRVLWENPLAVGAVALAVGAAAGFALPQTERENQLMGETRDNLLEQAQSVASETVEKVQQVAGEVAKTAEQTVSDKSREVGLTGNKQ
jgi:ElaB/YqjD/DUF883 family membrane-anchored ribosome-binding protein